MCTHLLKIKKTQIEESKNAQMQNSDKGEKLVDIHMNPQWQTNLSDNENPASQSKRSTTTNKGVPPDCLFFLTDNCRIIEPKCWEGVQVVKNSNERQRWINNAKEEVQSFITNKTWELVGPLPGRKVIGC